MSRVVAVGTFDLLHEGHVGYFKKLRKLAGSHGLVTIGVNSDEFATAYKRPPHDDEKTRSENVLRTGYVNDVFINPGFDRQGETLLAQHPDIVAITDDWYPPQKYAEQLCLPSIEWFDEHRILFCYVMRSGNGISTTKLLEEKNV